MPLVAVGISQNELGSRDFSDFSIDDQRCMDLLVDLTASSLVEEAVVVNTCARTEVYAVVSSFHAGVDTVIEHLSLWLLANRSEIAEVAHVYYDNGASRHLFRLTSGIESTIIGESEIIGQVKRSYSRAHDVGTTKSFLERLFQRSLEVGKKVRSETAISQGTVSSAYAATEMLARIKPGVERALVVGAGEIGSKITQALVDNGVSVHVANRTAERGEKLAESFGASSIPLDFALSNLVDYDAAFFATGTSTYLVEKGALAKAILSKVDVDSQLVLFDLGMPRNLDPQLGLISSVELVDLERIYDYLNDEMKKRRSQISLVEEIIDLELADFSSRATQAATLGPTIASLYAFGESVKSGELERFRSRLSNLDPEEAKAVEALVSGIVGKILHAPVSKLKQTNLERAERLADSLHYLFGL